MSGWIWVAWGDSSLVWICLVGLQGMPLLPSHCRLVFLCVCLCVHTRVWMCICVEARGVLCGCCTPYLYVYAHAHACVCMYVYMEIRGQTQVSTSIALHFIFQSMIPHWPELTNSTRLTGQWIPRLCLSHPIAGITAGTTILWGLRNELKSLYSKHFTVSAIFPALFTVLSRHVQLTS